MMPRWFTFLAAAGLLASALILTGRLSGWAAAWHGWRAEALAAADEPQELAAAKHLLAAVEAYPGSRDLRVRLERAIRRALEADGAESVAALAPVGTVASVHLAWELERSGASQQAEKVSPEIPRDLSVFSDPVLRKLAGLALKGDADAAESVLREWELRSSGPAGARFGLGIEIALGGMPEAALPLLREEHALPVGPAWVRFWRGFALLEGGHSKEAERSARMLTSRARNFSPGWHLHGLVLERQGRLAEAVDAYERALELAPDSKQPRERLRALRERSGRDLTPGGHAGDAASNDPIRRPR